MKMFRNQFLALFAANSLLNIPSIECKEVSATQDAARERSLQSTFTINESVTASDLVDVIVTGSLLETRNPTLTGSPRCSALFSGGTSAVTDPSANFPDSGFVLGTGIAENVFGQDGTQESTPFDTPGDPDFETLNLISYDACVLEFEFRCGDNSAMSMSIDYVFGSDEYREQVQEILGFGDRMGIFLNGYNIARIPGTNIEVSLESINDVIGSPGYVHRDYFVYNNPRIGLRTFPDFEPDGFTKNLNATAASEGGWNKLKIGVVDMNDFHYDTWVFVSAGAFDCTFVPPEEPNVVRPCQSNDCIHTSGANPGMCVNTIQCFTVYFP